MADLDTPRPEVRAAMEAMDADVQTLEWLCIRAELLRLMRDNDALRSKCNVIMSGSTRHLGRAEKAEAELAALKARTAGSPACNVFTDAKVYCCVPRDWVGKRVRLVVEK